MKTFLRYIGIPLIWILLYSSTTDHALSTNGLAVIVCLLFGAYLVGLFFVQAPGPIILFSICCFLFLYSRIFLTIFSNIGNYQYSDWFLVTYHDDETVRKGLLVLSNVIFGFSMIGWKKPHFSDDHIGHDTTKVRIGLYLQLLGLPFYLYRAWHFFNLLQSEGYLSLYVDDTASLNPLVNVLASFYQLGFLLYLAGRPTGKKNVFIQVIVFTLLSALSLANGARGEFFCSFLVTCWAFAYLYKIKLRPAVVLPVFCVLAYLADWAGRARVEDVADAQGFFTSLQWFVYAQGISINVIFFTVADKAFDVITGWKAVASPLWSAFNVLFHFAPQSNNQELALHGWSFAHRLAYAENPDAYLQGNGLGTSFVSEIYLASGHFALIGIPSLFGFAFFMKFLKKIIFVSRRGGDEFYVFMATWPAIIFTPRETVFYALPSCLKAIFIIWCVNKWKASRS